MKHQLYIELCKYITGFLLLGQHHPGRVRRFGVVLCPDSLVTLFIFCVKFILTKALSLVTVASGSDIFFNKQKATIQSSSVGLSYLSYFSLIVENNKIWIFERQKIPRWRPYGALRSCPWKKETYLWNLSFFFARKKMV